MKKSEKKAAVKAAISARATLALGDKTIQIVGDEMTITRTRTVPNPAYNEDSPSHNGETVPSEIVRTTSRTVNMGNGRICLNGKRWVPEQKDEDSHPRKKNRGGKKTQKVIGLDFCGAEKLQDKIPDLQICPLPIYG